nr:MAG TPA: hypothetical protein [Caudoviricetes sp.]
MLPKADIPLWGAALCPLDREKLSCRIKRERRGNTWRGIITAH